MKKMNVYALRILSLLLIVLLIPCGPAPALGAEIREIEAPDTGILPPKLPEMPVARPIVLRPPDAEIPPQPEPPAPEIMTVPDVLVSDSYEAPVTYADVTVTVGGVVVQPGEYLPTGSTKPTSTQPASGGYLHYEELKDGTARVYVKDFVLSTSTNRGISCSGNLTLIASSGSSITTTGDYYAIYAAGNLTVTGYSTLRVSSAGAAAIVAGGVLTIDYSCKVNVTSLSSNAIIARSDLLIRSSSQLTAAANGSATTLSVSGNMTLMADTTLTVYAHDSGIALFVGGNLSHNGDSNDTCTITASSGAQSAVHVLGTMSVNCTLSALSSGVNPTVYSKGVLTLNKYAKITATNRGNGHAVYTPGKLNVYGSLSASAAGSRAAIRTDGTVEQFAFSSIGAENTGSGSAIQTADFIQSVYTVANVYTTNGYGIYTARMDARGKLVMDCTGCSAVYITDSTKAPLFSGTVDITCKSNYSAIYSTGDIIMNCAGSVTSTGAGHAVHAEEKLSLTRRDITFSTLTLTAQSGSAILCTNLIVDNDRLLDEVIATSASDTTTVYIRDQLGGSVGDFTVTNTGSGKALFVENTLYDTWNCRIHATASKDHAIYCGQLSTVMDYGDLNPPSAGDLLSGGIYAVSNGPSVALYVANGIRMDDLNYIEATSVDGYGIFVEAGGMYISTGTVKVSSQNANALGIYAGGLNLHGGQLTVSAGAKGIVTDSFHGGGLCTVTAALNGLTGSSALVCTSTPVCADGWTMSGVRYRPGIPERYNPSMASRYVEMTLRPDAFMLPDCGAPISSSSAAELLPPGVGTSNPLYSVTQTSWLDADLKEFTGTFVNGSIYYACYTIAAHESAPPHPEKWVTLYLGDTEPAYKRIETAKDGRSFTLMVRFTCVNGVIATGWSGDLTWTLTTDNVLTFSGTGAMKNYTYKSEMPWYSYLDQITAVVLEPGATSIGDYAFYGAPAMKSISIPDTVTSIGSFAFKNAVALESATLPENLSKLGESAFYACTALKSIDIPASLYTIQPYTFKNCTGLTSVTFHEGNLQKISDGAFYGTALTSVVLPDCLDILDSYVFKNCSALADVKLGSGLTQIREASLYGTAISSIVIPEGVTVIKPYAFKNCTNLTTVTLPSTLTAVDEAAFYACTRLTAIELPDSVKTIGNYAFRKCTGLTRVEFGIGLTTIGESSFYGCTGLTTLTFPNRVTEIQAYAFKGCTGLTDVLLGSGLTTLGESAFHTCTGLKTLDIPDSVTSVGAYCFSGSYNLWRLTFRSDAPAIGAGAFRSMSATIYYPGDNATWTDSIRQNYGGTITWKAR